MTPGRMRLATLAPVLASALLALSDDARPASPSGDGGPPNILVIVADDLGVDRVGAYGEHPDPGHTPVIDALAADGLLFRNAWTNPSCGPSRAAMLTGRYAATTGFGWGAAFTGSPVELALSEVTIAEVVAPAYRTAAVGKWHLSSNLVTGVAHPNLQGFEHFRGSMGKFPGYVSQDAYSNWQKVTDGVLSQSTTYATTEAVDDTLALISGFGNDPWFVWLAFHAPHAPFHKPPAALHSYQLPSDIESSIPVHVQAMAEAMDTEIGRLLASLPPSVLADTIIIFIGDNGTDGPAVTAPFDAAQAKGTVFEGGVNVPLIISGPGVVQGGECSALVNATDLFATVAELAGAPQTTGSDSVSLVPYLSQPSQQSLRTNAYTEIFFPNGAGAYQTRQRAVRNTRFKLIYEYTNSSVPSQVLFYDLDGDPFETTNLLDSPLTPFLQNNLTRLTQELEEPYEPWISLGYGTPGVAGTPALAGSGSLLPMDLFSLSLIDAAPSTLTALVIGLTNLSTSFSGGIFVPSPDAIHFLVTDPNGELSGSDNWPPGVPGGVHVLFQFWVFDPTGPFGLTSSNGLAATTAIP